MKRKTAVLVGNILMALGLIVMIGSIVLNLSSHIFSLNLPDMIHNGLLVWHLCWCDDLVNWSENWR
ncbi:DUF2583 family protein [Providencia stuartii]|uniref:DUF2583 family protein n=1 Tax=Providencia stuartii TaxID=588 RepID=UPI0039C71E19